jgi:hypothetical protein
MIAYTLTIHDEKYPAQPDQIVGIFTKLAKAIDRAGHIWITVASATAAPLHFDSYDSSYTGLDFHIANGYRDFTAGKMTFSINGFNIQ